MSLREIATNSNHKGLQNGITKNSHQKTLLFTGSKNVGKTTLINRFLDRNDPAKKTLALEYTFARKTSSHSLAKDVCHIWELGGGTLFTSVLENGNSLTNYGPLTVIVMLDLSETTQFWSCLDILLEQIKQALQKSKPGLVNEMAQLLLADHPDRTIIEPFPTPLVLIGGKYDIFQEFEPEKKKIVCRCLRYVAHLLCATLVFYSSKDATLVKRVKDTLNHHAFGSPQLKTVCVDYNKAIYVPSGSDLVESIEGVGGSTTWTMEKIRHVYTTHFPQEVPKMASRSTEDPVNDPNFREPLVDALRRQKDEELERYSQEIERKERRTV